MIRSNWHIHSEYSYDATLPLETIAQEALKQGFTRIGITDHLNFNDESFKSDLRRSAAGVKAAREKYPFMELAAALKENGKYVECNSHFSRAAKATEKYRYQYAEFLRELFEMGLPITYGSDSHHEYTDNRENVWNYLSAAGFTDGDITDLPDHVFWG